MPNNVPMDPRSFSLRASSLRQQTELAQRVNQIQYTSSNPALSYIYSLAATDTTGGQANAKYTLERLSRYIIGDSFQLIDWAMLFSDPARLIETVKAFLIQRARQKAKMKSQHFSEQLPLKNLQVKPLLNALLTVSKYLQSEKTLSLAEVILFEEHLSHFNLNEDKKITLEQGWLQPIEPQFYRFELSTQSRVMLEAFSCFCIRRCVLSLQ